MERLNERRTHTHTPCYYYSSVYLLYNERTVFSVSCSYGKFIRRRTKKEFRQKDRRTAVFIIIVISKKKQSTNSTKKKDTKFAPYRSLSNNFCGYLNHRSWAVFSPRVFFISLIIIIVTVTASSLRNVVISHSK